MPIEFRCTKCERLLRTADGTEGQQAQCPQCGTLVTIPMPAAPGPAAPPPGVGGGTPVGQAGSPSAPPPGAGESGSGFAPVEPGPAEAPAAPNPYQSPGQQGQPTWQPYGRPGPVAGYVPNYLVQAILCTLFCCMPFGVVAIVFAAQVNSHLTSGNYEAALSASQNARTWCWVSFWLGIVPAVLLLMLVMWAGFEG